ncbi:DUF3408 domain-containing protein [Aquimarina longa]|uniref:DUF3408 domain-containing protein n=1 Tax=Aquimarina longa TaxID=1080221 RepID=UPI00078585B3|nr:DUF3408 domain-containing protein [Aquimarina longa]
METHLQTIILVILLIERFISYKRQQVQKEKYQQVKEEIFCLKERQKHKKIEKEIKEQPSQKVKQVELSKKPKVISKNSNSKPYQELFLQKSDVVARKGKSVYIQPKMHKTLFRITREITDNEISVANYLDNILRCHFEEYQAEITKQFEDKYKSIF